MLTINGVSQYQSHFLLSNIQVFTTPPLACYRRHLCCSQSPSLPHQGLALQASFRVKLGLFLRLFESFFYFVKSFLFTFFDNNFAQKLSTRTSYVICGAQCENGNSEPLIQKLRISKLNQAWAF